MHYHTGATPTAQTVRGSKQEIGRGLASHPFPSLSRRSHLRMGTSNPQERRRRRAKILRARRHQETSKPSKTPLLLQQIDLLHDPKATRKLKNRESAFASRRKKVC